MTCINPSFKQPLPKSITAANDQPQPTSTVSNGKDESKDGDDADADADADAEGTMICKALGEKATCSTSLRY